MIARAVAVLVKGERELLAWVHRNHRPAIRAHNDRNPVWQYRSVTTIKGHGHSLHIVARLNHRPPLLRRADAAHDQTLIFQTSNHVHIDHGYSVLKRHDGMIDVVA